MMIGPASEILVDEVDGAAGILDSVLEGLGLGFQARERGQQGWVDVQNPPRVFRDEVRAEKPHEACKHDEIHLRVAEALHDETVIGLALDSPRPQILGPQPSVPRRLESRCVGIVADHDRDLRVEGACVNAVGNGFEVRATSREQDAETLHWTYATPFLAALHDPDLERFLADPL